MKYCITFAMIFVLLCGMAQAQDTTATEKSNAVFGGVKYVVDIAGKKTLGMVFGYAFKAFGPLWSYTYVELAPEKYGAFNTEIGYPITISKSTSGFTLTGILLAGPNADWVGATDSIDLATNYTTYLVGAGGALINAEWANGVGLSLGGKYKFRFDGDVLYQDGTVFGLNLFKRF